MTGRPRRSQRPLLQAISAISRAMEARDAYTADHQRKVAELARRIAQRMSLDAEVIEGIRLGATLHDIGKIAIPSAILTKPKRLNEHEYGLIRMHPEVGHGILDGIPLPWPVAQILHQHHERPDGSGYPLGLSGDAITLETRVVTIADVFDSMASHRPYRQSRGIEAALRELHDNRGRLYDRAAVEACLAVLKEDSLGYA